ncbi:MAG: 4Fe-4S binding protein [Coriobacteriales bacterium]|jgi:Fe-S-cluster-containing dehydrogenase component|nr:4Fe-4S binding protein [Coriobacteriales bacterium]
MATKYGLLIDYEWCTGCHSCETACKVELDLKTGDFGIKLFAEGPKLYPNGKYEYLYLPVPTSLCNLCEERVAAGKLPTCVHHCQSACMSYGPVEELAKKAAGKPKTALFVPR